MSQYAFLPEKKTKSLGVFAAKQRLIFFSDHPVYIFMRLNLASLVRQK